MFVMIYPQLCWLIALGMMGLSSTMATSPTPTSQNDKAE